VVCSLLERGWFRAAHGGADDAGHAYGEHPRFWVEEERRGEFSRVSEARRAAWAWRRYVTAACAAPLELRYESLLADAQRLTPARAPSTPAVHVPSLLVTLRCASSSAVSSPKYQTLPFASWLYQSVVRSASRPSR